METPRPPKRAATGGGILIAIGLVGGAVIGGLNGQPSIGLLAGLAVGALGALLLWLRER